MRWFWLSSERMTVLVCDRGGIVIDGPPIVRKFIGQPSKNLGRWMRRQGGFRVERVL